MLEIYIAFRPPFAFQAACFEANQWPAKTCIVFLGMHRSVRSARRASVALAGDFAARLAPPPRGQ